MKQSSAMVTTEIELPDEVYRQAERLAADTGLTLADVVRNSLERTLPSYSQKSGDWRPPQPVSLGIVGPVEDDERRLLANDPTYVPKCMAMNPDDRS